MKLFYDYDIKYPDLMISILEYFWLEGDFNTKTVIDFCTHNKYNVRGHCLQPQIILKICDILMNNNILSLNRRGGALGGDTCYSFVWRDSKEKWQEYKCEYNHICSSLVYGFDYIYRYYTDKVIPIIAYMEDGTQAMGSAFKFHKGIVTARHCVEDGAQFAIKGYSKQQLENSKVYVSQNPAIDIAYIDMGLMSHTHCDTPKILDDVLVMGYPKIPLFLNFLTAEKAAISTMAKYRMTPTTGAITAIAPNVYTYKDTDLLLITARIKGGNSGGPIINKRGCVVGVAFSQPYFEGNSYDDLGYGIGMPITVLDRIISEQHTIAPKFCEWIE